MICWVYQVAAPVGHQTTLWLVELKPIWWQSYCPQLQAFLPGSLMCSSLSVCFTIQSQKNNAPYQISKLHIEMFHDESWKPIYSEGQMVKDQGQELQKRCRRGVFAFFWVPAISSLDCNSSTSNIWCLLATVQLVSWLTIGSHVFRSVPAVDVHVCWSISVSSYSVVVSSWCTVSRCQPTDARSGLQAVASSYCNTVETWWMTACWVIITSNSGILLSTLFHNQHICTSSSLAEMNLLLLLVITNGMCADYSVKCISALHESMIMKDKLTSVVGIHKIWTTRTHQEMK